MAEQKKGIPEGYHTLTPQLISKRAKEAIEFYKKAFGAEEKLRMPSPDGKIAHAEVKIGDSIFFVNDEYPEQGGCLSPESLKVRMPAFHLYVEDVDDAYEKAIKAGAKSEMLPTNMFWGDRYARILDPFGYTWGIATQVEVINSTEELKKRAEAFYMEMARK